MLNVTRFVVLGLRALIYGFSFVFSAQSELTAKGHEVIALKSDVRDLSQKLESKERRVRGLDVEEANRPPERCDGDGNCCDDRLAADKLYSLVRRLNERVRRTSPVAFT